MAAPDPADRLAIDALVAQYCDGVNRHDAETWGATWAEDASWDLGRGRAVEGRTAIVELWKTAMSGFSWVFQIAPNGVVDVEGDTATGRWYVIERFQRADGAPGGLWACYHDRYVRTAEGWRFASRALQVIDHA